MEKIGLQSVFETAEFQKGLDTYIKGVNQAEGKTTAVASNIGSGLAGAAVKFAAGAAIAVTAAGVAMGAALASTIGPASDLNETISKSQVVFGKYGVWVTEWGKNSAKNMGMSTNAALTAASTYGNLFRSMNMGEKASFDMSTGLVQVASDLASFNNLDPTEVMDKLRAGLTGESEPLKSLGVNINETIIKQKAMAMGLKEVNGALSPASKAQAVYALIMEQTSLAQGDFARTSGGLANQQRIVAATIENTKAKIGTALLPVMTKMTNVFTKIANSKEFQAFLDQLIAGITEVAGKVTTLVDLLMAGDVSGALTAMFGPEVTANLFNLWNMLTQVAAFLQANWVPIVAGLVTLVLGFVVPAFITWAGAAVTAAAATIAALAPVLLPILAIAAVVALLAAAWQNDWGGIREAVASAWAVIQPILQGVWNWLQINIPLAIQTVSGFWTNTLLPALLNVWAWVQTNLIPLFASLAELLSVASSLAVTALAGLYQNTLQPAFASVADFISKNLSPAFNALGKFVRDTFTPVFERLAAFFRDNVTPAFDGIGNAIASVIDWVDKLTEKLKNVKLPKGLTPGSPTPFEIGLRGISSAMDDLSRRSLPSFNTSLANVQSPASASSGFASAAASSVTTTNVFNVGGNTIANGMDAAQFENSVKQIVLRMI